MTTTDADAALLDDVTRFVADAMARDGRIGVLAFVATPEGATPRLRVVLAGDAPRDVDRMRLVASLRHMSIRSSSPRAAVAMPEWIVDSDVPAAIRSARRLLDKGRSIAGHPGARETVSIMIESDAGRTIARLPVVRTGGAVRVEADDAPIHLPRSVNERHAPGTLTDFHVPTSDRIRPDVIAWARRMDEREDDMVPVEP